eukprot:gene7980-8837_t
MEGDFHLNWLQSGSLIIGQRGCHFCKFMPVIIVLRGGGRRGCIESRPLGLSNGGIKNYQITASSYLSPGSSTHHPSQARLGIRNCWCGNYVGQQNSLVEWIQVNFERPVVINAIATQGNPDISTSFVKKFFLEFSDDGTTFYHFNDTTGTRKDFIGNSNNTDIKFNWLTKTSSTKYVRFRALELNDASGGSVCLRMEFYGCSSASDDATKYGSNLFPLGIENGNIKDSAISSSSYTVSKEAKFARLNHASGWCALSNADQWLQVDLGRQLPIRAVAIQGYGAKNSQEIVKTFQVSHSLSSQASSFKFIEDFPGRTMLFSSDAKTNQDPFMALFPNSILARYIKIIPKTKGADSTMFCMRIELYGNNQNCYKGIAEQPGNTFSSSSVKTGSSHANAFLFSANSWCANANDVSPSIKIEFPNTLEINGIAIQGDAKDSNWVKTFKIKYKPQCGAEIELPTIFDGNSDQHGVMRHWFDSSIKVDYLLIVPLTWNNKICLRFQVIGCSDDLKRVPLGMQNGFIPTSQTFASSQLADHLNFGPGQGRIGMNTRWCGKKTGVNFVNDFHQVDFGKIVILTGIATQGDPTYSAGDNYVKKFSLEIANSTSSFSSIKTCSVKKEFVGNINQNSIKYNYFGGGVVARYVRFRAMELARTDNGKLVCMRLEYYGMELYGYTAAESKALYALGMENSIIQDSQLTASSEFNGNPPANSRLNNGGGWCPGSANNGWLQIAFPYAVTITAVALQGHGGNGSPDRTYKYHVQYYESSTWKNVKDSASVDKLFIGNKDTSRDPVMDFLPTPLTVDKLRINPYVLGTGSVTYCLRTEINGYHSVCSDDLTNSADTLVTGSSFESIDYSSSSFFNNPLSWCANSSDSSPYLLVNLGSPKTITGFGVQGDSNGDNWPTEVKISYGNKQCCLTEMTEVFKGNGDRNRVVLHWFTSLKTAQFLKIKITLSFGKKCMRIKVLGCSTKYGRTPLGMSNGLIKNNQITATSRFDNNWPSDGSAGRLRVTGNRWCSARPLNYTDYLQVDFKRIATLTGIATQGDDGVSTYVKKFYLQVSLDGATYNDVTNQFYQRQIFTGNSDNTGIVYNWLAVPTRARYVRFRATDVQGLHICARLEYYGSIDDLAADKSLYPLGMESGIIEDSQLTSSSHLINDLPQLARLWHAKGWCVANGSNNEWLQIDLKQQMVVSAVATQSFGGVAADMTYKYYLQYNKSSSGAFEYVKNASTNQMLFTGNKPFKNLPVLNLLPIPVTTQVLRISPIEIGGASLRCLRAEVYGYHPECSDDLTILNDARITASSSKSGKFPYTATVNSANAWCPASASVNEYIQIDLGHIHRITGIGIQGDLDNDFWPKKFKISHGNYSGCLKEINKEYIANSNRNGITRHWFSDMMFVQFIRIRVTSFNGDGPTCLRIQILGCKGIIKIQELGRTPLGMSNGLIKNDQITATSEFTYPNNSPSKWFGSTGRLRVTGNRWCSAQALNYQDYLQVDFKRVVTLTGIATQGDDSHNNYVKKFYLQVSLDGATYNDVTNQFCQRQIFTGNSDNTGIVYNWLAVPTRARYVRFRATDVQGLHICARLEYYGPSDDTAADKSLYPLGMESGVIEDSQLSSSNNLPNDLPQYARLWHAKGWCAPNGNNDEWLQIDLKQQMVISAVSTQSFGGLAVDMTYKYYLKYNKSSSGAFEYVKNASTTKMLFTGNKPFKNLPVLNLLPIPVTTQFLRINPIEKGGATVRCLRAEIYGYHPVCFDDLTKNSVLLTSTNLSTNPPRNIFINTMNTWCAQSSDTNGYIDVILSSARVISAVGIQGDSNNDYWVTTFKISHSLDNIKYTELSKTFIGNQDRNTVVRNWLLPPVFAKYIRIKTDTFNTKRCARIQAIGCSKDYAVISNFNVNVYNMRNITFQWKTIHSSSSNFTIQFRKTGLQTWTNITDVAKSQFTLTSLAEKYKSYEVRLHSVKGILLLDSTVTGGLDVSQSKIFIYTTKPAIIPASFSHEKIGTTTIDVKWTKLTQDQILDWDITGIVIHVSCAGDVQTKSCSIFVPKEKNITDPRLEKVEISGLASWTNYSLKIKVYNGDKRGDFSAAFTVVTAEEAPSVAPVIASVVGNIKTVQVTTETEITRDCTDLNWINRTYYEASKTSFTITGLKTWTKYEVKIQVFNSAGSSPASAVQSVTTKETEPSIAPSNIRVVVKNATSIDVSWSVLKKNDTNGIITKYILILRNSSTSAVKSFEVSETWYNLTGLKPFTNYSIKIAAATNIGPGPYSDWLTKQTFEAAPNKAPSITSISTTKFSAAITIENIKKEDENGVILGYKISYRCLNSNTTRVCESPSGAVLVPGKEKTDFILHGLKSWTRYNIKIAVYTSAGIGPFSAENMTTTSEEAPIKPPKSITLKSLTSTSLLLEWKSMDWDNTNGIITFYTVAIKRRLTNEELFRNVSASNRSHTFINLKPYTNYTVRIAASNKAGRGPYSNYIMQQTREDAPAKAPRITKVETLKRSLNFQIQNINKTDANGKLIGYYVSYKCVADANTRDCPDILKANLTRLGYPQTAIDVFHLFSWMKYALTIQVYNSAGVSTLSNEVIATTKEDYPSSPPRKVTTKVTGSKSIIISWQTLAKNDTNGEITGYEIRIQYVRKGQSKSIKRYTTALSLSLLGLFPYTEYSVKIAANNSAGLGVFSKTILNRTLQDAPSAPHITQTTPQGTTVIYVKWSKPVDPNGIITKYQFKYCLQHANCTILNLDANLTDILVTHLETHVNYTFKIRAFTIKPGNWSQNVTQRTEEGIPTMPLHPTIENPQTTSLKLSWKDPSKPRGALTRFKIKGSGRKDYNATFSHVFKIDEQCGVTCTSRVINNLTPGTSYTFQISVSTSVGFGPYSSQVTGETLISKPPKPRYVVVNKFQSGGTERNVTFYSVTNLYGPIVAYQVIVERITPSTSTSMTSFPDLKTKTEAEQSGLMYYLATERRTNQMPSLMRFQPGIPHVDAFNADLDTPGNYYLHFRAVSQRSQSARLFGLTSVYHLELNFLKKLPEPKKDDIKSSTIKIKISVTLPKGFTAKYYYVIAVELVPGSNPSDPSTYKQADLKQYDAATYQPGTPYIAAVLTPALYAKYQSTAFLLGDGQTTTEATTPRRKRQARAAPNQFVNTALKPEKSYSVFIRAVSQTSLHYSTPWIAEMKTSAAPIITKPPPPTGIIVGVVIGLVIALVGAGLAFYLIRKRRQKENTSPSTQRLDGIEDHEMKTKKPRPLPPPKTVSTTDVDGFPYEPKSLEISKNHGYPAFPVKDILQVVRRKSAKEDAGFNEEFQELPKDQLFTWSTGFNPANKPSNRFANIIAYDYNRVKLRHSPEGSDYINATYILDYQGRRKYIACQGPIPKSITKFWTLVWEQEVAAIVMLTKCVEGNKKKCEEYWPTSDPKQFGNIRVSFLGVEEFPEYVLSTFEIQRENTIRTCKHFHYIVWPDHGVPAFPTSLLSFRRRFRQLFPYDAQRAKPVIVHCSAGVGRTGAFIAVDTLINLIERQRLVDVFSYVNLLRLQRRDMVQRANQYKFIYECLLEAAFCGVTEFSAQEFTQKFNKLSIVDRQTGEDGFHKEFARLAFIAIDIGNEEYSSAKEPFNNHKNRDQTLLPRNAQRVFLPAIEDIQGGNYINAMFVDGQQPDEFISTQAPLESTIVDFWRMVVDRGSSTIISLVDYNEAFPSYYSETGEVCYGGQITVNLFSSSDIGHDLTLRKLTVTDSVFNRTSNEVHHYSINIWPKYSVPGSTFALVTLINEVEKSQRTFGGGPIIVHCSNGAGRTGTFIAAYTILERLKDDQMIDVFQTVRRIRKACPKFVENRAVVAQNGFKTNNNICCYSFAMVFFHDLCRPMQAANDLNLAYLILDLPVNVSVQMVISDMFPYSDVDMHYSMDFYLRMIWYDYRLAYNKSDSKTSMPLRGDKLWKPDIYFPVAKRGSLHSVPEVNEASVVFVNGTISHSQRFFRLRKKDNDPVAKHKTSSKGFSCGIKKLMNRKRHEETVERSSSSIRRKCSVQIDVADNDEFVSLHWNEPPIIKERQKILMKDFNIVTYTTKKTSSSSGREGKFDTLLVEFKFYRYFVLYFLRDFFPCILIVLLSWLTFWIDYTATPARVGMGITTVLTIVTMTNSIRNNSPPAGLFTSLDYYLLMCNIFVFAALGEYAIVGLTPRTRASNKKTRIKDSNLNLNKSTRTEDYNHIAMAVMNSSLGRIADDNAKKSDDNDEGATVVKSNGQVLAKHYHYIDRIFEDEVLYKIFHFRLQILNESLMRIVN